MRENHQKLVLVANTVSFRHLRRKALYRIASRDTTTTEKKQMKNMTRTSILLAAVAAITGGSLQGAVIYDGFEVGDGTLAGNAGGTGLPGNWSGASLLTTTSLSYGALATSGGRGITNPGTQFDSNSISPGNTLTNAGLMADGATVWFSALLVNYGQNPAGDPLSGDFRTYISLGTGGADGFDRVGGNGGSGFTAALSKNGTGTVAAQAWNDGSDGTGGAKRSAPYPVAPLNSTILVVGSITWGEFGVTPDVFNVYLPGTDLVQGSVVSTVSADFDQLGASDPANAFDTISIAGGRPQNGTPEFDELRFGSSYAEVTPIPEPSAALLGAIGALALLRRRR